ncbi:MAG: DUF945 family protein [Gammaproteobacteria bacterium]
MRQIIGILILCGLIALAVLSPVIDGYYAKQNYLNLIAALNQQNGGKFKVLEYHLGWSSSDAKTALSLDPSDPKKVITVIQHIQHGPILHDTYSGKWSLGQALIQSSILLPEPISTFLFGAQGASTGIFQSNTLVTFNNEFISSVSIPAINVQAPNGTQITWQGMTGTTYLQIANKKISHVQASLNFTPISLQNAATNFSMENFTVQYEAIPDAFGLLDGTYSATTPAIQFASTKGNLSLANLNVADTFNVDTKNLFNNILQISFENLMIGDLTVNSTSLKLSLNNLDPQGIINYVNTVSQVNNSQDSMDPAVLKDTILHIFTPTTMVSENIVINTPTGNVVSDGKLSWDGGLKAIEDAAKTANFVFNLRISISLINHILDVAAQKEATANQTTPDTANLAEGEAGVDNQIDAWTRQDAITLSVGIRLKDLVKTRLAPKDFNHNVDDFVLRKDMPKEVADLLKIDYAKINWSIKPAAAPQSTLAPNSRVAKIKNNLQDLLQKGYLKQDKDDYVISITQENGTLKINGLSAPQ